MPTTTVSQQLDQVTTFIENNLRECCKEILDWHDTGKLTDGKVREAAHFLTDKVFEGRQLVITENMINREALTACTNRL